LNLGPKMSLIGQLLFDTFMAVSPLFPYVAQYKEMHEAKSSGGFSTYVCLILLVANILRVFFWVGKRFDTVLLAQSLLLIVCQFVLLELCVRLRPKTHETVSLLDGFQLKQVWAWTDFSSYVVFIAGGTFAVGLVTLLLLESPFYVELLGGLSLSIEATLGLPQVIRNHQKKSVAGVSNMLIVSWFVGDLWKTYYFVSIAAPTQFVLCGIAQIAVDSVFAWQVYSYSYAAGSSRKQFSD
jgi:hypothetical protein